MGGGGSGYVRLVANWTGAKCIWRRPQVVKYGNEAPPLAVTQQMISDQRKAIRSINLIIAQLFRGTMTRHVAIAIYLAVALQVAMTPTQQWCVAGTGNDYPSWATAFSP